jgi:hypothetical protein
MDFDPKTLVVLLGISSAVVALAYRFMPRATDRLRRDLELLRLARGAKVNHLALQRHVDAQIHETYVKAGLSLKRKVDIVFGELFFATLLSTAVMAMIGVAVAYGAKQALPLDDAAVGRVLTGFVAIGLLVGLTGGSSEARKSLDEARREMRKRQRMAVDWDPGGLGEVPAGPGD